MTTRDPASVAAAVKAYDIRGIAGETLDQSLAHDAGASFARLMREEGATRIVIGHDMRPSSPTLAQAFGQGARSQGLHVVHVGLASTDELYFASGTMNCPGAMVTASHNPAKYNGIKFCRAGARPVSTKTGLERVASELVHGVPAFDGAPGPVTSKDILADFGSFLRGLVDVSTIRPLTVAVDAGNGMGGLTVPEVFKGLPITIKPLYFDLDGSFPHHPANPLEPENLNDLKAFVQKTGADLGLALDGDADRCVVVDEHGDVVSPSAVCAVVAESYLKKNPGAAIIHNVVCSKAVPEIIAENGGRPIRTRVGHSYIKDVMAAEHAVFGGEHSAHYYFTEFFNADSGLLAALHVLSQFGHQEKPCSEWLNAYTRYCASGEKNTRLESDKAAKAAVQRVLDGFADRIDTVDRLDGVSVQLRNTSAWFSLRSSNTEPLLRLNVEASTMGEVDALTKEIEAFIHSEA